MSSRKKNVIFVCVSNTCRSPMAEQLFRDKVQALGLQDEYTTCSRSLSTAFEPEGSPASAQGVEVGAPFPLVEMVWLCRCCVGIDMNYICFLFYFAGAEK
jgi:hypothetical protein